MNAATATARIYRIHVANNDAHRQGWNDARACSSEDADEIRDYGYDVTADDLRATSDIIPDDATESEADQIARSYLRGFMSGLIPPDHQQPPGCPIAHWID